MATSATPRPCRRRPAIRSAMCAPPLTTFKELGREGEERVAKVLAVMREMDQVVDTIVNRPRTVPAAAE